MEAAARPCATEAAAEHLDFGGRRSRDRGRIASALRALAAPDRWPGYFLVRQRALTSAQRINAAHSAGRTATPGSGVFAERLLLARGGRLAGRPDRFDGRILTEYKSSIPDAASRGAEGILEGFRRQLQLYAAIIAEALATWPAQGRIVAASGQTIDVPLDPRACEAEANDALAALDSLNRQLSAGLPASTLGRPGEQACASCPFQALCPSFWPWLGAAGSDGLPEAAAAGVLHQIEPGLDGDLYTAYLSVRQPAVQPGMQPLVLRRCIDGDLTASPSGADWRIVSAKLKPDGRLRADSSTCVFALADLPSVVTAGASLNAGQRS